MSSLSDEELSKLSVACPTPIQKVVVVEHKPEELSPAVKLSFLAHLISGIRFKHTYSMPEKRVSVTFRTLYTAEREELRQQCLFEEKEGNPSFSPANRSARLLTYMTLASVYEVTVGETVIRNTLPTIKADKEQYARFNEFLGSLTVPVYQSIDYAYQTFSAFVLSLTQKVDDKSLLKDPLVVLTLRLHAKKAINLDDYTETPRWLAGFNLLCQFEMLEMEKETLVFKALASTQQDGGKDLLDQYSTLLCPWTKPAISDIVALYKKHVGEVSSGSVG